MKKKSLLVASAMTAAVVASPAFADPEYITDRTSFLGATVGDLRFESFEDFNGVALDSVSFDGFTVSETGDDYDYLAQLRDYPGTLDEAITDPEPTRDIDDNLISGALGYSDSSGSSIVEFFSFYPDPDNPLVAGPITAFGLDITVRPGRTMRVRTVTVSGDEWSQDLDNLGDRTPTFWGVVDPDGITSIKFETLRSSETTNVGFDAVSYGIPEIQVPEPPEPEDVIVHIDIKFCSDPNAFNCKSNGVLPVTIFGTDSFKVENIDVDSIHLCLTDLSACTEYAPRNWSIADRGAPDSDLGASSCAIDPETNEELDYLTQDGRPDLDVAFEASDVLDMLSTTDFCEMEKNAVSGALIITGSMDDDDGTPFSSAPVGNSGIDQLVKKGKKKDK